MDRLGSLLKTMRPMQVVSAPDPDYRERQHDHLWILVGGGPDSDGATAHYIGADRDVDSHETARAKLVEVARRHGLDLDDALAALSSYRRASAHFGEFWQDGWLAL